MPQKEPTRKSQKARIVQLEDELKALKAEAAESALFRAVVEASGEAIAISDSEGRLVYINPAHERLFGRSLEEARNHDYRTYYPSDAVQVIDREVAPALRNGQSWEGILDALDAEGNRFPLWERADTVRDENGAMRYGFGIMHDARTGDDGNRLIAVLRESEQRYRTLFEQNRNPIGIIDKAGRYLDANPAFLNLVEKSKEELLQMRVFDFAPPGEKVFQETSHVPAWDQGGTMETKYWVNGRIKIVELTITPIQYRGRDAVIGVGKDITDRKIAEQGLIESQTHLLKAQRLANMGHWTWDLENGSLEWSAQVYHIFGVDPSAFEVTVEAFEAMIHPEDRAEFLVRRDEILEKRITDDLDHRIVLPSGEIRFVRERIGEITPSGGRVRRVIGTVQDITAQKEAEAARSELAAQRQHLQKAESLARMAGAVAHYFNNQFFIIMGNLEMALEDIPDTFSGYESISKAMNALRQASDMSGLMLEYLGHRVGKSCPLDLSEFCRGFLSSSEAALPENVDLRVDLPKTGPVVLMNSNGMERVLFQLMANAREAVAVRNGGWISVSAGRVAPAKIQAENRFPIDWKPTNGDYGYLSVSDSGEGIRPTDLEQIFDPFFTTRFTGRGLGLAVVLGTVRAYGGAVAVESRPGHGSTFQIFLPTPGGTHQPDGNTNGAVR